MTLQLGYLVFGVRDVPAWHDFFERMLGLPAPVENPDGSIGWTVDAAAQRLIVTRDDADDVLAIGIDCGSAEGLAAAAARLRDAGFTAEAAPMALAASRRVSGLRTVRDPAGNTVELFHGLEPAAIPFRSAEFPSGFRTAEAGLGHAALVSGDPQAMERFYVDALGFGVTERLATRAGPVAIRGSFLHCNPRHHSIAIFDLPSKKRLHHFMLQANAHMDVGRALERSRERRVPLSLDLGQHPAPDGTFSFYGITPSGFDFEIGAGSGEIDPRDWQVQRTGQASSWGHRPQWRTKWRLLSALVSHDVRKKKRSA